MTAMTMDEVKSALAPYHGALREVIENAFAEWRHVAAFRSTCGYSPILYPRTTANYMFDAIARAASSKFSSSKGVRITHETQTIKFMFDGKVIVRFKKGDEARPGQNILTQAVLDYLDPQQTLPGFPAEAAKVEIVWKADDIGSAIEAVTVLARNGNTLAWSYNISDETAESAAVLPLFAAEEEQEFSPLVIVKPRTQDRESQ